MSHATYMTTKTSDRSENPAGTEALALAHGWAPLEPRKHQRLRPLRRQPFAHDPRIRRALRAADAPHDLRRSHPLALAYKVHAAIHAENCTMCKIVLDSSCTVCSLLDMKIQIGSPVRISASDDNRTLDGKTGTVSGFSMDGYVAVTLTDGRWFYFEPRELRVTASVQNQLAAWTYFESH